MKKILIDFTKSPVEVSDRVLGYQGEQNATELIITPPTEMSENADIVSYAVAFQIGSYKVHHSAIYEKADSITVPIERKVSKVNFISLQLEGYDGEKNLLVKSELIDNLIFDASVVGEEDEGEIKSQLIEQIAKMKEEISKRDYTTVTLTNSDFIGIAGNYGVNIELAEESIPVGTELKTIRFNYNGQMIDIKDMAAIDEIPYILNMGSVNISHITNLPMLATIGFLGEPNTLIQEMLSYSIPEIEVDYYI